MISFELPPHLAELRQRVRSFVDEHVIPNEAKILDEDKTKDRTTLKALRQRAQKEGLFVPHLPKEQGGLGLGAMGMCALFREMGRSPIGAAVFNCDAPDQGNMDLLLKSASPAVRERWLAPLARAEITSGFSMTEPAPGAGADPSNLKTRATKVDGGWVIDGHKWYTTGGGDAAFLIVMARTSDDPRTGATMFVVDRHAPGVEHIRDVPVMSPPILVHREAELRYVNVKVSDDAVLGQVGDGFRLAQARLVPARLTHCMRWLGLADRTLHLCREYIVTRESFGKTLAHHQMIQKKIADAAVGIHAGNLMTLHCASMLEQGKDKEAKPYSSMAKNHVARLLCQVLDDAIQMHGALGYSEDMPFSMWYRFARAARIADGPDEVHDVVVARDFLRGALTTLVCTGKVTLVSTHTPDSVAELLERDGVTQACEVVEDWVKAGRWPDLLKLSADLEAKCPTSGDGSKKKRAQYETVADHIEDEVALHPGADAIDTILKLAQHERVRSVEVPRTRSMRFCAFASRLGYGQTADSFLGALEHVSDEHQELFACWMHEIVLRGRSLANEPRALEFRKSLAKHPLGALPLELRPVEREVPSYMPLYGDNGLGRAIDSLASGQMAVRTIPPPEDGSSIRATRIEDPSLADRLSAAVRPWSEGRSGKVEGKAFELEPSIEAAALGSWLLRALPLDSTSGVARLDCSRTTAEGVFGPLFSAASNGGAYSAGLGGAYGRLAAWTSLGALVGAEPNADIAAIETLATSCSYLTFRAPGPWFHDVAWDLGVVALRQGGKTACVLAATDNE